MLNRRNIIWLIPLLLLITAPAWRIPLASFLEPRGGFDPSFGKRDLDTQNFVMNDVIIQQNQGEQQTAEIRAEEALTSNTPNEFILKAVNADLYDENGDLVNVLARTGLYNTDTEQLTLQDDVRVDRTSKNQQLYSDLLYYYGNSRTIKSPGKTRLVGKNIEIKGGSLDYDITTNKYQIGGRVYCTIEGFESP